MWLNILKENVVRVTLVNVIEIQMKYLFNPKPSLSLPFQTNKSNHVSDFILKEGEDWLVSWQKKSNNGTNHLKGKTLLRESGNINITHLKIQMIDFDTYSQFSANYWFFFFLNDICKLLFNWNILKITQESCRWHPHLTKVSEIT